jgi:hypothetical protein
VVNNFIKFLDLGFDKFLDIFGQMGISVSLNFKRAYENSLNDFFDVEIYTKKYSSREEAQSTGGGDKLKICC